MIILKSLSQFNQTTGTRRMSHIKNPVIKMLLGQEPHDGKDFSDHMDEELRRAPPRRYWWRRHLEVEVQKLESKVEALENEKGLYKNTLMSLKVIDSKSSEGREMIDITLAKFNKQGK